MPSIIPEDLSQPGTHALVIGVSEYLHFEDGSDPTPAGEAFRMEQLSAAARSASEFAAWLKNDYRCERAPLKSLRVLLSPSGDEQIHADISALLDGDFSATLDNVKRELGGFRQACNHHIDNVAIVYVAGHGVQLTKHGAIVLLHDIGAATHLTKLEGAIDMAGVHAGMNHPNTARTQFWFVDACRQKPRIASRFETLEGALTLDEPVGDTEASPMFLAATTGTEAFARVNGVTLFNEALMWALRGGASEGPDEENGIEQWHISVTKLIKKLPDRVKLLAEAEGVDQSVDIAGKIHEAILHQYENIPAVDLQVELLPDAARLSSKGELKFDAREVVVEDFNDWPLNRQVEAGLYLLSIKSQDPYVDRQTILQLAPPAKSTSVNVEA